MANEIAINRIEFSADLQKYADAIDKDIVAATKIIALAVYERVVGKTPWDTGRARMGWNIGIGGSDLSIPPEGSYPQFQDDTEFAEAAAVAKGRALLGALRTPDVVWVSNAVPYIGNLNEGSSRQAPRKFVETTVAAVEADVAAGAIQLTNTELTWEQGSLL